MAYTKQTWTDTVSLVNAARLGHIEDGVEAAANVADAAAPLASPALTGAPTAPDPTTSNGLATKGYVDGLAVLGVALDRITDAAGSTDTVITSGVVDDILVVPLPSTGRVDVVFFLPYTGDVGDDIKMDLLGPSGATIMGWASGSGTGATGATGGARNDYTITGFAQVMVFGSFGSATANHARGEVTVVTTGTSGNLTFRYARNANSSGAAGAGTAAKLVTGARVRSAQVA